MGRISLTGVFLLVASYSSFSQNNSKPEIIGQTPSPLSATAGSPITIELFNLIVVDEDPTPVYPDGFSLEVSAGKDYKVKGTTVTPDQNFEGKLLVPVRVNDGKNKSDKFDVQLNVARSQNSAPKITGQQPLTMNQGGTLTIELGHLIVTDADNNYPTGFTLKVFPGKNYTVNGATITPPANFSGKLTVPVTVSDGQNESNRFDLKIDVIKTQNSAPKITGQQPLTVNQGGTLTIELAHLTVTDADNNYPTGFTLKVFAGKNYTVNGATITPSANFSGKLTVPVTVSDGQNESNRFDLKIDVIKTQNTVPQITGQVPLSVHQGESLTVELRHLAVTDPDNSYPGGFTLKVLPGMNFALTAPTTIKPSANFVGTLAVSVTVSDGQNESNVFVLKIDVVEIQNAAPQVTGQEALRIQEDSPVTLHLGNLRVTDSDNVYPKDFSMRISGGVNYTMSGLTITPVQNFSGELTVPVIVNDGQNDSAPFNIKVEVSPVNDAPVITGQTQLSINKNTLLPVALSNLTVTDPDDKYPEDFTLKILGGDNYSFAGNIIIPAPDFVGLLNVRTMVNDGTTNSPEFKLKIEVLSETVNTPPTITGQKPIRIAQNTAVTLQLSHLSVSDPDNKYPHGFTLDVFPGDDYTVNGTTITPRSTMVNVTLTVRVVVNDGKDNSQPFPLKIQIVPPSARPQINGQKELIVLEDNSLTIHLTDLSVVDTDDPDYPTGFILIVLPQNEGVYSRNGNTITPAHNLNGFIEVGVLVSDGTNTSDEFKVVILVSPVNDPPEFIEPDTTSLAYKPGHDPLAVFETINLTDVDDDHLILAEVGFQPFNYNPINDQCILSGETSRIRSVYDSVGTLFLVGYASIDDYVTALRNIRYNYLVTQNENGNPTEILAGPKRLYLKVFDSHLSSVTCERTITMEVDISLDIPNAFTPNGDHQNDTWQIGLLNAVEVNEAMIRVYDKRGGLVYESKGLEKGWDGSFNGQTLAVDTYYYTIDLNLSYMKKTYKGAVTILY